jgi:hypothetical protein
VLPPATDGLLDPVTSIDGFRLAGLIDASTGTVLACAQDGGEMNLLTAAAGATDRQRSLPPDRRTGGQR